MMKLMLRWRGQVLIDHWSLI